MPSCPVCHKPVVLATLETPPFCCERCRLVDLGRWLEEGYGVPAVGRDGDDDDEEPPPAFRDDSPSTDETAGD